MSNSSGLDLDRYSNLDKSRRSASREQIRPRAKHGEVLCDFCTSRKQKAEKSCLVCLASYCETHLQSHYDYPTLMKHKLVKATGQMREKICAQHDKLLEAFCRTDQTSVCVLCMMDEHKHHDIVPAGTERTEKQKQLGPTLHKSQQRIDQRIKKWQDLRQAVESVKHSAQTVMEENERIFSELLLSIERKYNEVKEMIRTHERTTVTKGELLLDRLEEEITLLRKRHTDLEKLSRTDDHIHFLQSWQSLAGPSGYEDLNKIKVAPHYSFEASKRAVAALRVQTEEVIKTEMFKISEAVKEVHITQEDEIYARKDSYLSKEPRIGEEPKTREDFLKYSRQLTLDVNTVHPSLHLSEGNQRATMKSEPKNYPDHPDRFDHWQQVLCRESVSGTRCYWEVDWSGTEIDIAITYRGIRRKGQGNECSVGWNDKSWSLYCADKFSFVHNNKSQDIPAQLTSRIGVYVDHAKGTLAFYDISGGFRLLHKIHTTFTEPVYPAFSVWGFGSTIRL
ncbi:tripartite motif-containing protein 16 [Oryzias latipes]|uniref:tripartite motif-containing protein 16 n=1 Tax=Oryzias latipes TaxID=8090 RepID=UPI0002A4950D|nr:tripartite motif-containing protein 16 [Oryzias latipes]